MSGGPAMPDERRCPRCGGPVWSTDTCHTWPQSRGDGTDVWITSSTLAK